jgi:subtilisin family serine protease
MTTTPPQEPALLPDTKQFTGRQLVVMEPTATDSVMTTLQARAGVSRVARSTDFGESGVRMQDVVGADAVVFEELGIAVVSMDPTEATRMRGVPAAATGIIATEPEQILYVLDEDAYLRGYRDGVADLAARVGKGTPAPVEPPPVPELKAPACTWGLTATGVAQTTLGGAGIRLCVLDTGLDLDHPDFRGRVAATASFVAGQTVQDGHGHGTHCAGTACGAKTPPVPPRYGVAHAAELWVGKVLSNGGSGSDASILAGIDWALRNRCHVVSMSLGGPVNPGEAPSPIYEHVGQRALDAGTLIVAAAGNESRRPGMIRPVARPANSKSFMAVAAVDVRMQIAWFSCGGINPGGGQVDIAGPGVDVHSTWRMPTRYRSINGTSMATPHVAGIAALWAERQAAARGGALWTTLVQNARRLPLPATDVGAGLVVAP